ncbi:MAG: dihydroneopterin aldolase [Balneolales bacterium]|nr:dihydroneopterin aldolase [Balneolales bacterium]
MNKILIKDLRYRAGHGYFEFEQITKNTFLVDVEIELNNKAVSGNDDLNTTIDYSEVCRIVSEVMNAEPVKLIETLLENTGNAILNRFTQIRTLFISIRKLQPPMPFDCSYVEISNQWQR